MRGFRDAARAWLQPTAAVERDRIRRAFEEMHRVRQRYQTRALLQALDRTPRLIEIRAGYDWADHIGAELRWEMRRWKLGR